MAAYSTDRPDMTGQYLFSPQLEGQPQPWNAVHLGVRYPGEVIVASKWDDRWGDEVTGNRFFRVVLLTSRQRSSSSPLKDARIIVCVPAQDVVRQRESMDRDLKAIAEARGLYVTGHQEESSPLRSSLEQRETELRGEFLESCSLSYGSGEIRSATSLEIEPARVFVTPDPAQWLHGMAGAVLARVYPGIPIDSGAFPRPLGEEELQSLFDVLLARVPPAATDEATASFAVGLGLARREAPSTFDPGDCSVFRLIRHELEARGGDVPMQEITRILGLSCGLPLPLVALFLLAFVKYSSPEVELDLSHDHLLVTREGDPFPGDRLTREMVEQIRWSQDIYGSLTSLHPPEPPMWNTALPFIRVIDPGAERAAPQDVLLRESALMPKLRELSEAARQALEDIRPLLEDAEVSDAEKRLQALIALGQSVDFQQFYREVRENFRGPGSLAHERLLPEQAGQLKAVFPEIAAARSYMQGMTFGPTEDGLSLNHRALLLETSPGHILENPTLWPAIRERFDRLRQNYRDVYVGHHAQYRREASALWARLQSALPLVELLEQLNSIPALGTPVGVELPHQFDQLNTVLRMCLVPEEEVRLDEHPVCPYCGLQLSESVPYQEIEAVLVDIGQALQEQNRRLSLRGIQQILERNEEEMVDKLIGILRVADMAPLANVLSPQVLDFLRTFATEQ